MTTKDTQITGLDDDLAPAPATETKPEAPAKATRATKAAAAEAKDEAKPEELVRDSEGLSGKKCILTIHADKGDGGNLPVFLGLNGRGWQIPRGVPCTVPVELLNVLETCVETVYDNGGPGREVPRFAYSVK